MEKRADAFRTISEAAEDLDLPQHVLRFWETRFPQIKPMKRGGGRRYYRPEDIELLAALRHLLYGEGYTIKGVQRILKQQHGAKAVVELVQQLRLQRAPAGAVALATTAMAHQAEGDEDVHDLSSLDMAGVPGAMGPVRIEYALSDGQIARLKQAIGELEDCLAVLGAAKAA